jgi:hypothetical protein
MTEQQHVDPEFGAPGSRAAWNVRIVFGSITLALCWAIIGLVLWSGDGGNTLHASALSWCFALIAAVLLGFGVGAVLEPLVTAVMKK